MLIENKQQILITGGNGYVAKSLYTSLKDKYDVTYITRQQLDLTNSKVTSQWFNGKYFDVIIHCAAIGGSRLKVDSYKDMDVNLAMYYNLLQHKSHYNKLIHFGSGAEIYNSESPYGLSKRVIANSISEINNFYNIRIFSVFDENELNTRFIKANILRYIKKDPMIVQDKKMTFFYMQDLITLVTHHIDTDTSKLIKKSECAYVSEYSLLDIANIINELSDYKVPIYIDDHPGQDYISKYNTPYGLNYIGLKQGIKETYNKLKI